MNDDAATPDESKRTDLPEPPASAIDPDPVDADPAHTRAVRVGDPDSDDGRGGLGEPLDTDFPTAPNKGGLTAALVSIGAGLLGAAVVISAMRARQDDKLDASTYVVGVVATVALLGLALVAAAIVNRRAGGQARGDLVTWPGVVGILATTPMIEVGLGPHHDGKWQTYLTGGVIAVLGLLGYAIARRAAFVVVTILGLAVLYARAFDDLLGDSFGHENKIVVVAGAVTAFVVVVTVLGWFLPSRAVTGVAVGVVGLVGVAGSMAALLAERMFAGLVGQFSAFLPKDGPVDSLAKVSNNPADYTGEVAWILVFVAVLTLIWALGAMVSDHSGFKVLAVALPAVAVPIGTAVLAIEHPTWWGVGLGAAGGVLLLAGLFLARGKARRVVGM